MPTRREFLGALAAPVVAGALPGCVAPGRGAGARAATAFPAGGSPEEVARDEDFWFEVQRAFPVDRSILNLNNGGVSPSPAVVQESVEQYLDFANRLPSYNLWRVLQPRKETVRGQLARVFGCDPEEIALVRNASEGLQALQFGFDLRPGDEVLTTDQDYPRMITTWKQRERRDGIRLRQVSIPTPADDPRAVVEAIAAGVTEKTRLAMICQVVNLTGAILPVAEIVRRLPVPVLVDGAHGFANVPSRQADLGCSFYATSLHKWLFAPHGTGMLYVKRSEIPKIWPLMAASDAHVDDIRKFEEIGTHAIAPYLAISDAVLFHEGLGAARKFERLLYLRDRWAKRLREHPRIRLHTSLSPGRACGIATVEIEGIPPAKLTGGLLREHRILVSPIAHPDFGGVRVSPSVYTSLAEIDRFSLAMEKIADRGLEG